MPNIHAIKAAIDNSDTNAMYSLIEDTSLNALFRAGLNSEDCDALIYAMRHQPVTKQSIAMIKLLLVSRDKYGNPLVNINRTDSSQRTALHHLLDNPKISHDDKHMLFDLITDLRDARGNLLLDISACRWHHGTPLMDAIRINHLDIIRSLLDLRKRDGSYAVDINEARSSPPHTALDVAYMHFKNTQLGQQVEEAIVNRGGKRYRDLNRNADNLYRKALWSDHPLHPDFDPVTNDRLIPRNLTAVKVVVPETPAQSPVQPIIEEIKPQANKVETVELSDKQRIANFVNNKQSTHEVQVGLSVNASVMRLKERYPRVDVNKALRELEEFIKKCSINDSKRAFALKRLEHIQKISTKRAEVNMTLSEITALIWVAIHDITLSVPGKLEITDQDIEDRCLSLADNLHQAEVEYGVVRGKGKDACFRGTFDRIVETLDRCHPDVCILTAEDQSAITRLAIMRSCAIVREYLMTKPEGERFNVLSTWYIDNDKTPAAQFREEVKKEVDERLKQEYSTLLPTQQRQYIINEIENMAKPILHQQLYNLYSYIEDLDTSTGKKYLDDLTDSLKIESRKQIMKYDGLYDSSQQITTEMKQQHIVYQLCTHLGDGRFGDKETKKHVILTEKELQQLDKIPDPLQQLEILENMYKLMTMKENALYTRQNDRFLLFFCTTRADAVSATFQDHVHLLKQKYIAIVQANIHQTTYVKDFRSMVEESALVNANRSNYVCMQAKVTKTREVLDNILNIESKQRVQLGK